MTDTRLDGRSGLSGASSDAGGACDPCLARTWLLVRLGGHLERVRARIQPLLELGDRELVAAVAGGQEATVRAELADVDPAERRSAAEAAGVEVVCRCHGRYPAALRALRAPPAVIHVAGGLGRLVDLAARDPVAIVGSRRPSEYGTDVARSLGRGVCAAGATVLSGMAVGIDSAAHGGALSISGATIAVLPGPADQPYPPSRKALHRRITAEGVAISELGPDAGIWRWQFLARNRIVAALAAATVVVEATASSGALVTAGLARELGCPVGAVPGRVTTPQAAGPNELLATGAFVVRDARDVVDALFGPGHELAVDRRGELAQPLRAVLEAVGEGADTPGALGRSGIPLQHALSALAELELSGFVRRGSGGRYSVIP